MVVAMICVAIISSSSLFLRGFSCLSCDHTGVLVSYALTTVIGSRCQRSEGKYHAASRYCCHSWITFSSWFLDVGEAVTACINFFLCLKSMYGQCSDSPVSVFLSRTDKSNPKWARSIVHKSRIKAVAFSCLIIVSALSYSELNRFFQ